MSGDAKSSIIIVSRRHCAPPAPLPFEFFLYLVDLRHGWGCGKSVMGFICVYEDVMGFICVYEDEDDGVIVHHRLLSAAGRSRESGGWIMGLMYS
ncbi:hypothetical protein Hanom_Chr10g00929561 [Helianthus anomalus]